MPAVSPTNLANWNSNEYYRTDEFRVALADALHEEYQVIVLPGLSSCRSTIRSSPAIGRCTRRSTSPNAANGRPAAYEEL